jgi:cysteinyl-tRNA synthetase
MTIRLFNTLTKTKEDFTPIERANVRMYVCGPTVYDFAHIGNARPAIVFDVLYRLLRHTYGADHVTYVRNITDVDDKINARALRDFPDLPLNEAIRAVTEKTEKQYHDDVAALGCLPPTHEPRATENIPGMIAIIQQLIERGHAYQAGGEVLFDIQSMPDYGALSRRKLDEQQAGARVAVDAHKKHPHDFVLWKLSAENEPGWESPWGRGRPGWHIECSAMSAAYLGNTFDIHGGGLDLIFPHHENEIAQSRCAHGTPVMANIWMHNGFLQVEGEKMSKSLGNFVTIRDLLRGWRQRPWNGASVRWAMLQTHYRDPIDWTYDNLLAAAAEVATIAAACDRFSFSDRDNYDALWLEGPKPSSELIDALSDDLNAPEAIAYIRSRLKELDTDAARAQFLHDVRFLGLFARGTIRSHRGSVGITGSGIPLDVVGPASANLRSLQAYQANNDLEFAQASRAALSDSGIQIVDDKYGIWTGVYSPVEVPVGRTVEELVEARKAARAAKNFAESDRIRDELLAQGIVLKDGPTGTTWEIKR